MNKDLKQVSGTKPYSRSSKKIVTFSFLAVLQAKSCVSGRGPEVTNSLVLRECVDLSRVSQGSSEFNKLQAKTADILSEHFAKSDENLAEKHLQDAFSQAIQKCDFKKVKSLLEDPLNSPFLTSKEVLKGLKVALKCGDTFLFRYKHNKIVDFLLKQYTPSLEDLCAKDESGRTLLHHLVIKRGDIDAVRFLVRKLPLEGLCAQDNKEKTPMHLAARYKSKKIFEELFSIIHKLNPDRAINELFKKDKNGYAVIESSYLPKYMNCAALCNNNKIQLPTFYRKRSEMFKYILQTLPDCLLPDQLASIAIAIDCALENCVISKAYAATLRTILSAHIRNKHSEEVGRYVSYKRFLDYLEHKYGSDSKEVQEHVARYKSRSSYIERPYGSEVEEEVSAVDTDLRKQPSRGPA